MDKYRLAVIGATGLVGRTVLKILEERDLPIKEYALFASKKSSGTIMHFMGKEYVVQELNEHSFDSEFDFAIFSAGRSNCTKICPYCSISWMYCSG